MTALQYICIINVAKESFLLPEESQKEIGRERRGEEEGSKRGHCDCRGDEDFWGRPNEGQDKGRGINGDRKDGKDTKTHIIVIYTLCSTQERSFEMQSKYLTQRSCAKEIAINCFAFSCKRLPTSSQESQYKACKCNPSRWMSKTVGQMTQ